MPDPPNGIALAVSVLVRNEASLKVSTRKPRAFQADATSGRSDVHACKVQTRGEDSSAGRASRGDT